MAVDNKAWEELSILDPSDVCQRTEVQYNPQKGEYSLKSFNSEFLISPVKREINPSPESDHRWLHGIEELFNISAIQYLIKAKCAGPSKKLVNPGDLKGGDIFFRGSHILPLDTLAQRYRKSPQDFLLAGELLGGKALSFGDASVELGPFPRIPVTLILWKEDEEFPPRMSLLFDSTADQHLPIDILWSIAMITVQAFQNI
jgi:hypothetical protein